MDVWRNLVCPRFACHTLRIPFGAAAGRAVSYAFKYLTGVELLSGLPPNFVIHHFEGGRSFSLRGEDLFKQVLVSPPQRCSEPERLEPPSGAGSHSGSTISPFARWVGRRNSSSSIRPP